MRNEGSEELETQEGEYAVFAQEPPSLESDAPMAHYYGEGDDIETVMTDLEGEE